MANAGTTRVSVCSTCAHPMVPRSTRTKGSSTNSVYRLASVHTQKMKASIHQG